jgi:hypothetical protein
MELFAYNCCQIDPTQVNYSTDQQLHSSFGVKIVGTRSCQRKSFQNLESAKVEVKRVSRNFSRSTPNVCNSIFSSHKMLDTKKCNLIIINVLLINYRIVVVFKIRQGRKVT